MEEPTDLDGTATVRGWHPAPVAMVILGAMIAGLVVVAVVLHDERSSAEAVAGTTTAASGPNGTGSVGREAAASPSGSPSTSPPTTAPLATWQSQFLACVADRESGDDATAVGPGGQAFGTYQITPETWDSTAEHYGWSELVGIRPDQASSAQQQQVAVGLVEWQGYAPWGGGCTPS